MKAIELHKIILKLNGNSRVTRRHISTELRTPPTPVSSPQISARCRECCLESSGRHTDRRASLCVGRVVRLCDSAVRSSCWELSKGSGGWMGDWNGWMDGWMGGWMDGWMGEWMDGWMGGCVGESGGWTMVAVVADTPAVFLWYWWRARW